MIASDRLEAFVAVAAEASFTRGASRIGITQSAASQRIAKLEDELEVTLFVRGRDAVRLTAEGEALLRHARACEGLEAELSSSLGNSTGQLGGVLRIGGFSSVTRSVIMPALSPLVRDAKNLRVHAFSRELSELPGLLRSGEADMIVTDRELGEAGFESLPLGMERNVLVEPRDVGVRKRCYLDHDPDDATTERFFRLNGRDWNPDERTFLDDIYGILDGVELGWGRAVVSAHLLPRFPGVRRVRGYKPLLTPVVLVLRRSRFRTRLTQAVVDTLQAEAPRMLRA